VHWAGQQKPWGADHVAGRELWRELEDRVELRMLQGDLSNAEEPTA